MCITHFVNLRYAVCVTLISALLAPSFNCFNLFICAAMPKLGLDVYHLVLQKTKSRVCGQPSQKNSINPLFLSFPRDTPLRSGFFKSSAVNNIPCELEEHKTKKRVSAQTTRNGLSHVVDCKSWEREKSGFCVTYSPV